MRRPREWRQAIARATKAGWDPAAIGDWQDVRAVLDGCWFHAVAADHVVEFFRRYLRHSKGQWAGRAFELLAWEEAALRRLFGWKRRDGTRRFRRGGIWIAKKNGKSTLAAGIELYLLVADHEPGAEVYSAANDRGQAGIIYDEAANMARTSPALRQRLQPVDSRKTIAFPGMAAKLQALSADVPTKEGLNAHGVINDELHARRDRGLWDTLAYAGASRRQPLNLSISTAGLADETSIAWEQYRYATNVIEGGRGRGEHGLQDWAFFALIYEADPKDDWTDPATWQKANPSFGVTIDPQTFAEECREAQHEPRKENAFRRYRLNQWVQQQTRWIPLEIWDANHVHPVQASALPGAVARGGLDLGSVSDLSAWILLFDCPHDPEALDVLARFWVPEAALVSASEARRRRAGRRPANPNAQLYQQWVTDGYLETTPGEVTDYDFIEAAIIEDAQRFDLRSLAIDRLFQGQAVSNHLTDEGLTVVAMGQGFLSMGAPMKEFERQWTSRRIHHGQHPILRWMAGNCEVKADPHGNLKIVKPQSHDPRKVDGLVALVMALDQVTRDDEAPAEDPDLVVA
jgi:phage terminase large subunit-like protein